MGIILLVNQTPIEWHSKLQKPVETATFGWEFTSACICTNKIVDTHYTLKSMGVNIEDKAWMLGNNQLVVTNSTIPYSQLCKCHNFLSYHHVRLAIAHGIMNFCFVKSIQNSVDFLTKPLGYAKF